MSNVPKDLYTEGDLLLAYRNGFISGFSSGKCGPQQKDYIVQCGFRKLMKDAFGKIEK